jgi:diguanylate cyclase (GGDEF)-like protein
MRISTITNWAYAVTVILTAFSGAAFIMSSLSAEEERAAVEEHLTLDMLAEELALGAEIRSDEARLFVMRNEERHLQAFHAQEEGERRRETAASQLASQTLPSAEAKVLKEIGVIAEELDKVEVAAVEAYQRGDKVLAQETLFGADHERLQTALLQAVSHFRDLTASRTGTQLAAARASSDRWNLIAKIILGLTGALFLSVLYFILRRRVAMPLMRMSGIVGRLAKQDYTVEILPDRRRDEIGEMNEAIEIFRSNGIERERLDAERQADQRTKDLILEMMHRLQACQNQGELADVIARLIPEIFPGLSGGLYILNASKTTLMRASVWQGPRHADESFPAASCWGLRRGRPHTSGAHDTDVPCSHLDGADTISLCVPLTAQGDVIGLLYLEQSGDILFELSTSKLYLELIAENVGLAVANLQLRETLTDFAIRDPLTGLFNRRHLEAMLEVRRADHVGEPSSCLMIDIDHFKRFNDQFGHDAGDMVMRYVGQVLRDTIGNAGSAFRFGGEEFTVLLPMLSEERVVQLAEEIRQKINSSALSHASRLIGTVSVSVGVAYAPEGYLVDTLMARADAALLEAKAEGRNRVVVAAR